MKTTQVEAKEIKIGDTVLTEEGNAVKIVEIGKGMPRNTIELAWNGGWAAVSPSTILERVV